jgi:hypothetical protein
MRPKDCSLCAKINKKAPDRVVNPGQKSRCNLPLRFVPRMELCAIPSHLRLSGTLNDQPSTGKL